MRIRVLTIFPELFEPFLATSLVGRAVEDGLLDVSVHDLREFTTDRHRSVDDEPYGGGGGMVMNAQPWLAAVEALSEQSTADGSAATPRRILMSPQGKRLDEAGVRRLAKEQELLLMCGRYEGIDQRVCDLVVDEELSIGDYVLSGGELAAMVTIEAVSRQIPGVIGLPESVEYDSFRSGLLDFPHYTRPANIAGAEVPKVLLSGNHAEIDRWRQREAVAATWRKRPDLLETARLTPLQEEELNRLRTRTSEAEQTGSKGEFASGAGKLGQETK